MRLWHPSEKVRVGRRPAELVAKFMDGELRSGKDKKSDDQLEQTLDKALMLFRYIQVGRMDVHSTRRERPHIH